MKAFGFSALMAALALPAMAQNVGIGTSEPARRLHVVSTQNEVVRLEGPQNMFIALYEQGNYRGYIGSFAGGEADVDFGTGFGNLTGRTHLTTDATPRLTVNPNGNVGIGNTNPSFRLDVSGDLRFTGRLLAGGSSGTAGQVLTSNGASAPSWQTLSGAYNNNVRFSLTASNNSLTGGELTLTTRYNTNPAAVGISGTTLSINVTGIYHFDIAITGRLSYTSALGYNPNFSVNFYVLGGTGWGNNPAASGDLIRLGNTNTYLTTMYNGFDMYLTAGQTLNISFTYGNAPAGYTVIDTFGYVRGYMISN